MFSKSKKPAEPEAREMNSARKRSGMFAELKAIAPTQTSKASLVKNAEKSRPMKMKKAATMSKAPQIQSMQQLP